MARLCLPKPNRDKIVKALKSGELSIQRIYELPSANRRKVLASYVGEDFAKLTNAKFEQAMLSNQKKAMGNWIKNISQLQEPIRRDMMKKVERLKKVLTPDEEAGFFEDLARDKLGMNITQEEAETILRLKNDVDELKARIPENAPKGSEEGMAYGLALDKFKVAVGDLKVNSERLTLKERTKLSIETQKENFIDFASVAKSFVASVDDSMIGRQGIKVLFTNPTLWVKTFGKSIKIFGEELFAKSPKGMFKSRNDAVMSAIRAEIYSRPNALNGKYNASKNGYGLNVLHEEAFPTSLPERLPFIGRLFKASESAFGGSSLYMRAELADRIIEKAEKMGLDMLDEKNATAWGNIVTSMTGRGELTTTAPISRGLNAIMFSPRFLKSNWNTVTAHQFDKFATPETKREAVKNIAKIATGITTVLLINDTLKPGSVDWNPASSNFGKIKISNTYIDITGGMSGFVRLGAVLLTGKRYSPNTRKTTDLTAGGFGQDTKLDAIVDFFMGKASPVGGAVRDYFKGENYDGEKPTLWNTSIGFVTPISVEIFIEELNKGNTDLAIFMLAEGFGFSPTDTSYRGYGKKWDALKEKDNEKYNQAIKQVGKNFTERADRLEATSAFQKMTQEEKNKALDKIRNEETDKIFRKYGIK